MHAHSIKINYIVLYNSLDDALFFYYYYFFLYYCAIINNSTLPDWHTWHTGIPGIPPGQLAQLHNTINHPGDFF